MRARSPSVAAELRRPLFLGRPVWRKCRATHLLGVAALLSPASTAACCAAGALSMRLPPPAEKAPPEPLGLPTLPPMPAP